MTRDEANMRIEAIELMYIAANHSTERAEEMIAERLTSWKRRIEEGDARCCLNVAKDWRANPMSTPMTEACRSLRERSAEAADLCGYRIAPWLRTTEDQQK